MKDKLNSKKEVYEFIGELAIALYSKKITITLSALKSILNEKGQNYSEQSNKGFGQVVSAAWSIWEKKDPIIYHAIAYSFTDKNGKTPWCD
jgi:hypothetical protein